MVPFYCPYCGEEDLEPLERDGAWFCRGCVRSFSLSFLGVGSPRTTAARESKESLR